MVSVGRKKKIFISLINYELEKKIIGSWKNGLFGCDFGQIQICTYQPLPANMIIELELLGTHKISLTVPPTVLSKNCKNLHIDQTTSHMLKEVPQVEKCEKFQIHLWTSELWPPTTRGRSGAPPAPGMHFRANFHKIGW